jgi:hypothetical protein
VSRLWLLLVAPTLLACEARRDLLGPSRLSAVPTVLTPQPPLDAPGPRHELCMTILASDSVPMFPHDHQMRIRTANGRAVLIGVTFVAVDGRRLGPFAPNGALYSGRGNEQVCWEPKGLPSRIARLELVADDSLEVRRVTWFSGERKKFLF